MSMTWEGYFDSVNTHKYPIPLVLRASQSYWLPSGRFPVSFAWGIPSVCRAFLLVVYLTHLCGPFKTRVKYCFLQKIKVKLLSPVWLFGTPWTVAYEAPPSMEFSRQVYWNGLPFLLQRIFPTQGSNPGLLHCKQMLLPSEPRGKLKRRKEWI